MGSNRVAHHGEDLDHRLGGLSVFPIEASKKIEIGLKKMNDPKAVYPWFPGVLFNEDVYRVAPSWNSNTTLDRDIEELG